MQGVPRARHKAPARLPLYRQCCHSTPQSEAPWATVEHKRAILITMRAHIQACCRQAEQQNSLVDHACTKTFQCANGQTNQGAAGPTAGPYVSRTLLRMPMYRSECRGSTMCFCRCASRGTSCCASLPPVAKCRQFSDQQFASAAQILRSNRRSPGRALLNLHEDLRPNPYALLSTERSFNLTLPGKMSGIVVCAKAHQALRQGQSALPAPPAGWPPAPPALLPAQHPMQHDTCAPRAILHDMSRLQLPAQCTVEASI